MINSDLGMQFITSPEAARELLAFLLQKTEDKVLLGRGYLGLSMVHMNESQNDSAIFYLEEMHRLFRPCPDADCQQLFWAYPDYLLLLQAEQLHERVIVVTDSLIRARFFPDDYTKQQIYQALTSSQTAIGDFDNALSTARAQLDEIPDDEFAGETRTEIMHQIATLHTLNGNLTAAEDWGQRAYALADNEDYDYYRALIGFALADIYLAASDTLAARSILSEALPIARSIEAENSPDDPPAYWFTKGISAAGIAALIRASLSPDKITGTPLAAAVAEAEGLLTAGNVFQTIHPQRKLRRALISYYQYLGNHQRAVAIANDNLASLTARTDGSSPFVLQGLQDLQQAQASAGNTESAYATLLRANNYADSLRSRIQMAVLAQAEAGINLDANVRARLAAEATVALERETARLRARNFWLILLAIASIAGILGWSYFRARKDQELLTERSHIVSKSLTEKEVLLREIHHRVKNNLQIISGLLEKQARISGDEKIRKLVHEGQERIQSMALIHQNLYQSEHLSGVNIQQYLKELVDNIRRSQHGQDDNVALVMDVAEIQLDIDTAIPLGLILNELITNVYKYAFPKHKKGVVSIVLLKQAAGYQLMVADNGVGLPADIDLRRNNSLGINLVNGLVQQLDGMVRWHQRQPGTEVVITFAQ